MLWKKTSGMCGAVVIAAVAGLSACGGSDAAGPDDEAWAAEQCPVQTASIYQSVKGKLTGDSLGTAITQGPIVPPAGTTGDSAVGLYELDDVAGTMTHMEDAAVDDVFCMEEALTASDREMTVDVEAINGAEHPDATSVDFTFIRTAKYPDGVWIDRHESDLPSSIPADEASVTCSSQWWTASDLVNSEELPEAEGKVGLHSVADSGKC